MARRFAQAHPFSLGQLMRRGHDEHERFAMHRDYLEFGVATDRQAQESNIERSGRQHLDLICGENIAKGEFYFCIQLSKLANDCGHNLIAGSRYESDSQNPQLPFRRQLCLMNSLVESQEGSGGILPKSDPTSADSRFPSSPSQPPPTTLYL